MGLLDDNVQVGLRWWGRGGGGSVEERERKREFAKFLRKLRKSNSLFCDCRAPDRSIGYSNVGIQTTQSLCTRSVPFDSSFPAPLLLRCDW